MSAQKTIQKADTRKSTSLLKKLFKDKFGIDVKVKSSKYSMGCSLNIEYALGPDDEIIGGIAKKLQYSAFDGMQDLSYNIDNEGIIYEGYQLEEFKHVFVKQEISQELRYKLAKCFSDKVKFSGVPPLENKEQFHDHFNERWGNAWNWSELISQSFIVRNFCTQDESKINIIDVNTDNINNHSIGISFIYEVDGVQYNTLELIPIETETKTETKPEKVEVPSGEVQIIEYSEKAIAVIGDTKSIKEKLKKLGGKFNFRLSCGPGWIFPKTKLSQLQTALSA